jgi:hypothetical protein
MAKGGRSRPFNRSGPLNKNKSSAPAQRKAPVVTGKASTTSKTQAHPSRAATPATPPPAKQQDAPLKSGDGQPSPAKPLSPFERAVSAFTRGFPYALAEYCLFLLAAYAGAALAIVAGAVVAVLAGADVLLRGQVLALLPAGWLREAENLLGQRQNVVVSLGVAGLGLILWAVWNLSSVMVFSWLSIFALLGALFLLLYAQWGVPAKGSEAA